MNKLALLLKIPAVRKALAKLFRYMANRLDPVAVALLLLAVVILITGCSTRSITYNGATYTSTRLLLKEDFKGLKVTDTNGVTVELEAFSSNGGAELGALLGEAIKHAK